MLMFSSYPKKCLGNYDFNDEVFIQIVLMSAVMRTTIYDFR